SSACRRRPSPKSYLFPYTTLFRSQGIREIGMVQNVVELGAELQVDVLGDGSPLEDREIKVAEIVAAERIPAQGAVMARAGPTVGRRRTGAIECTRNGKGREIQEVERVAA